MPQNTKKHKGVRLRRRIRYQYSLPYIIAFHVNLLYPTLFTADMDYGH
jgi:hypothetical protein